MSSEEVDLEFNFSNEELANFLDNFAEKIRDGEVGLSFRGRKEVEIRPTEVNQLEMEFQKAEDSRQLELEINLREERETTDEGRKKIPVEVV